jgi:hypothetical protein
MRRPISTKVHSRDEDCLCPKNKLRFQLSRNKRGVSRDRQNACVVRGGNKERKKKTHENSNAQRGVILNTSQTKGEGGFGLYTPPVGWATPPFTLPRRSPRIYLLQSSAATRLPTGSSRSAGGFR